MVRRNRMTNWSAERLVKEHEGRRLSVYVDSRGFRTVGYGHRLEGAGLAGAVAAITPEGAERLFEADLRRARAAAADWLAAGAGRVGVPPLAEPRFAALVDMAFNLGPAGLSKFVKLRAALADGDYERAAREMLDSAWAGQVGRRARTDAALVRDGAWPDGSGGKGRA